MAMTGSTGISNYYSHKQTHGFRVFPMIFLYTLYFTLLTSMSLAISHGFQYSNQYQEILYILLGFGQRFLLNSMRLPVIYVYNSVLSNPYRLYSILSLDSMDSVGCSDPCSIIVNSTTHGFRWTSLHQRFSYILLWYKRGTTHDYEYRYYNSWISSNSFLTMAFIHFAWSKMKTLLCSMSINNSTWLPVYLVPLHLILSSLTILHWCYQIEMLICWMKFRYSNENYFICFSYENLWSTRFNSISNSWFSCHLIARDFIRFCSLHRVTILFSWVFPIISWFSLEGKSKTLLILLWSSSYSLLWDSVATQIP